MGEYISKSLAVEELENLRQQYNMHDDCDELVASKCKNAVSELPAADVAPVVHGHWEPIIDPYGNLEGWICGCGRESKEMCNYCPNCGAKMGL